ncbi:YfjI family protein [Alphaproteobacteria bacterium]|nr:YfjI family protein [Alphaproteobacteria bacterium]
MPRKPNYKFERFERDRAKAEKKAARLQAKADRRSTKKGEDSEIDSDADGAMAELGVTVETSPKSD